MDKYILIADAGSTKTDWALIDSHGNGIYRFASAGINAVLTNDEKITAELQSVAQELPTECTITNVQFYGAGCATEDICNRMKGLIEGVFTTAKADVNSDLLGAARSLLGDREGIACILGTGSNSCLYDGNKIIYNVPSLGFILGDEGSGAALGKRLVADALKGHLPQKLSDALMQEFDLTLGKILEKVYREPSPNRFLASLVPFLGNNIGDPHVYSLIWQEFQSFFKRNVVRYDRYRELPISFTGSIAHKFAKILRETAESNGFRIDSIKPHPIDGLIEYHSKHEIL